jgi:hypothetical protein
MPGSRGRLSNCFQSSLGGTTGIGVYADRVKHEDDDKEDSRLRIETGQPWVKPGHDDNTLK